MNQPLISTPWLANCTHSKGSPSSAGVPAVRSRRGLHHSLAKLQAKAVTSATSAARQATATIRVFMALTSPVPFDSIDGDGVWRDTPSEVSHRTGVYLSLGRSRLGSVRSGTSGNGGDSPCEDYETR